MVGHKPKTALKATAAAPESGAQMQSTQYWAQKRLSVKKKHPEYTACFIIIIRIRVSPLRYLQDSIGLDILDHWC